MMDERLMDTKIKYTETLTTSSVRPSQSFFTNKSFISTNFATEIGMDQLRKSRIQNLPNSSKKVNLAGNLQFVVVFQTIEIERLSTEIESNRIKIKDFQRQIFNAQNYEVQIRELTEKCFSYESERSKYLEENEKLNLICHQLYTELEELKRKFAEVDLTMKDKYEMERSRNSELMNEIERWKARYMASEKSKAKELDDLRLMMESQRKSMLDREMRELTIKFQAERGNLENQIRKLRQNLEYKLREIEELKQRSQKFQITIMELKRNQVTIHELENKLTVISQQLYRLNDILKQKQDELEGARQREYKLQQQLKEQQQWEFENKQIKTNLQNRTREIEEWRIRYSKLDEEVARNKDMAKVNHEINSRLGLAGKEIERLNETLRIKLDEIDQWKQRLARQEAETNKYRTLESELRNYENKVASLSTEIQRLNGLLKQRLTEIDDWKSKVSKLQITIKNYTVIERDNRDLQDKMQNNSRTIEQFRHKITRYETDITNLRLIEKKYEDAERKNGVLNGQLERLNGLLRGKAQELDDFRVRYSKLESTLIQFKNIEAKVQEYEHSFAVLTQEVERLNNALRVKTDEITRLNDRIRGLEDQVAFLKSHETKLIENQRIIETLNITINEFKRNFQLEQEKTRGMEGRARDFESQLYASAQEKDRLSALLKQKGFEFDEIRSKYSRLEQEMYQLREVEAAYREAKNQMAGLIGEIERLERACLERESFLKKEQEISNDLGCRVIVLCAELERANSGSGMKSKELIALKETFYMLEKTSREQSSEILVLTQRISNLEKQLTFVMSELERFLALINANEKRSKQLEVQITTYQDYARRIKILSAEIDRLTSENKNLEEDLTKIRLRYADNLAFEGRYELLCMNFVLLFVEVESLRGRIAEKDAQFEEMRMSYVATVRNINN